MHGFLSMHLLEKNMSQFLKDCLAGIYSVMGKDANIECIGEANIIIHSQKSTYKMQDRKYEILDTTARDVSNTYNSYYSIQDCNNNFMDKLSAKYVCRFDDSYYRIFDSKFKENSEHNIFSKCFLDAIGRQNCSNIYGVTDFSDALSIYEALLEAQGARDYLNEQAQKLMVLLKSINQIYSLHFFNDDNQLCWRGMGGSGTRLISLLSHIFNLNRLDSIATLEKLLDMKFSNINILSSRSHVCEKKHCGAPISNNPEILKITLGDNNFEFCHKIAEDLIFSSSGQIIGAFVSYKWGDRWIILPSTVGRQELCIGKYNPTAFFFNQHLINSNPKAIVLLFQDARTAVKIQRLLDELIGYNPTEFIITAHLGDTLNILPWHDLTGHDVIFVPAPSKAHIALFKEYKNFICGVYAKSCKIVNKLFLHTRPVQKEWRRVILDDEEEKCLLQDSVVVQECENIIGELRKAIKNALDEEGYQCWAQKLGIINKPGTTHKKIEPSEISYMPKINEALMPPRPQNLSEVCIFHIFRPGTYVYIVGKKGAGKTQLCYSICSQLLHGTGNWPFFHGGEIFEENICYVDGETPQDEFIENLKQYGLNEFVHKRLFCLTIFGEEQPDFMINFSLGDEKCRKGLKRYLLQKKCRIIILDCLLPLTNHAPDSCVRVVLDFIKELQQLGICVILINHKSQEKIDKARSNENYLNEARVVISIMDKGEIIDNDESPDIIKKFASRDGLTLGLKHLHNKVAPILQNKTIYLYLPLYSNVWTLLGTLGIDLIPSTWQEAVKIEEHSDMNGQGEASLDISDVHCDDIENTDDISKKLSGISPDARKVYEAIKDAGGSAKREDLEMACEKSKDTILQLLKELINEKLVESVGSGKGTYYKCKLN